MAHITMGYLNVYLQLMHGPGSFFAQMAMIIVILTCLLKLFFFLRIFDNLTYIVTMIFQVVHDLQVFMIFFFVLIFIGSLIFDIIGDNGQPEYRKVGQFVGNFFYTLRLSLGDFDFTITQGDELDRNEVFLFWISWNAWVIFSLLIFLNFIIAEVSNSYQIIRIDIDSLLYKERAGLIAEAESIMPQSTKESNPQYFPVYLITREMEY